MLQEYLKHKSERETMGIPPLPLNAVQTEQLCKMLINPPEKDKELLLYLIANRIPPGVDEASKVKAEFLEKIILNEINCSLISPKKAIELLGTMLGGYNVQPLIRLLNHVEFAKLAASQLKKIIFVFDQFNDVLKLSKTNKDAEAIIYSWAEGEWFTSQAPLPEQIKTIVYKVNGEVNTDDFSPAGQAWSRSDIPLHSLSMGETRFPKGIEKINALKEQGLPVTFVADVVGTGSSRKSACNSLIWHIGEEIPFVPNKKRGGLILGSQIAPIFFNTAEDSGALPIRCDVAPLKSEIVVTVNTKNGTIVDETGNTLISFDLLPNTLSDEYQAGGRMNLIIGRNLTSQARQALGMCKSVIFKEPEQIKKDIKVGYSLAQKIVGRAAGLEGVLPNTACEPKVSTVGSQDTTGLMTEDELKELACLKFQAPFVMQSFCHTAAYPKPSDIKMHRELPVFIKKLGGVSLNPGDGVVHTWLNRFILPDTVGTGGDSHTRFPFGISFPAGSGLVAFAAALGYMPLDMPESVLVRFSGDLQPGITLRDVVYAIPYFAIQEGLLTVGKKGKKNIFNGRILEMEGLPFLSAEQAFELTDASAERSAAAATIKLDKKPVMKYIRSNVALIEQLIEAGYGNQSTLKKRKEDMEKWLDNPILLERDENAQYVATINVDLDKIKEPILACPNDPDDVKLLSEVAGTKIDEVFLGSCMTNIGHFRAASKILQGNNVLPTRRLWLCPPTRMDQAQLKSEGIFSIFGSVKARIEIPGCSLCMGNQARVNPEATVFSTSTRNFDNRMGDGAQVFLGSAELGAVTAISGRLPTPQQYFHYIKEKVEPKKDEIYKYLDFSQ